MEESKMNECLLMIKMRNNQGLRNILLHRGSFNQEESRELLEEAIIHRISAKNIRLLLGKGFYINSQNKYGMTILMTLLVEKNELTYKIKILNLLLDCGADVNIKNIYGHTPLFVVNLSPETASGNVEMMKILLSHGADINAKDNNGSTLLLTAIRNNYVESVKLLLNHHANVNEKNNHDQTPLLVSINYHKTKIEIIKLLLDYGADVNMQNIYGRSALSEVMYVSFNFKTMDDKNFMIQVLHLIFEKKPNVNQADMLGETPLLYALTGFWFDKQMQYEAVKLLLDNGADVNLGNNSNYTPMMAAVKYKACLEILQDLINQGAKLNFHCGSGATPLTYACIYNPDIIPYLIENGADINYQNDKKETTLLYLACTTILTNMDIIKLLIEKGANVNTPDIYGYTPLMYAIRTSPDTNTNFMKILLDHGANVNDQSINGSFPLLIACFSGQKKPVELLLKYGANTNMYTPIGLTPLLISVIYSEYDDKLEVIQLLLQYGANINKQNFSKESALMLLSTNCPKTLKLLLDNNIDINLKNENESTVFDYYLDTQEINFARTLFTYSLTKELHYLQKENKNIKRELNFYQTSLDNHPDSNNIIALSNHFTNIRQKKRKFSHEF
jgi:ankyrin repeat protein